MMVPIVKWEWVLMLIEVRRVANWCISYVYACAGGVAMQGGASLPTTSATPPATTRTDDAVQGDGKSAPKNSMEDTVLEALTRVIDEGRSREVVARGDREARNLKGHISSLFKANTEEGTRMKQGDWYLYCRMMFGKGIPRFEDVRWPPERDAWLEFILDLRPQVSSYKRFQGVIGNVCEVANRYWSRERNEDAVAVDPHVLYRLEHCRAMNTVKREYGLGVRQVEAISMREALSACNFADAHSLQGMAAAASFAMGCLMGGRRPRTLTAIKLRDVEFTARVVEVHGVSTCAPGVVVTFKEEMYDDSQGPWSAHDHPDEHGAFEKDVLRSCAF